MSDTLDLPNAVWWDHDPASERIVPLDLIVSDNQSPRKISLQSSSSLTSTSSMGFTSGATQQSASASSSTHSLPTSDFGHDADKVTDRRSSVTSQIPQIDNVPDSHHSRHASVQSALTRSSSRSSTERSDHAQNLQRSISPVSVATTFGGAARRNHRSRTTTAETAALPQSNHIPSFRSTRSDSFDSDLSRQSTISSFTASIASRRSSFRMSLPPNISRHSVITPEFESDDPLSDWAAGDARAERERAAERQMRSAPGVMGVGEGWAGGPAGKRRTGGWFRRKGRRKGKAETTQDPLALWTVPEEPRTSPLKSAWNRSRARFGASVPVLSLSRPDGKGAKSSERETGQKARSVFSVSRTELRMIRRQKSESTMDPSSSGSGTPKRAPLSRFTPGMMEIPERVLHPRVPSQPHLPLPRTTSLSPAANPAQSILLSGSVLSRINTFGDGGGPLLERNLGENTAVIPASTPAPVARRVSKRRALITKVKSRLSNMSISKRSDNTSKPPSLSPKDLSHPTPNPPSNASPKPRLGIRKSRPPSISHPSMLGDNPPSAANSIAPKPQIRTFLNRLVNRRSSVQYEAGPGEEEPERPFTAKERKRKSFSAGFQNLNRWSKSEANLLRSGKSGGMETLDDLLARLKEIPVPNEGAQGIRRSGKSGDHRAGALEATQETLSGVQGNVGQLTPRRSSFIPSILDPSPPRLEPSSSATTRSSSTTAHTATLSTPPMLSAVGHIGLEPVISNTASQRPSAEFAWAARPSDKLRDKGKGEDESDGVTTRRWLLGSRRRSSGGEKMRG